MEVWKILLNGTNKIVVAAFEIKRYLLRFLIYWRQTDLFNFEDRQSSPFVHIKSTNLLKYLVQSHHYKLKVKRLKLIRFKL
jgi:hypothetical protein